MPPIIEVSHLSKEYELGRSIHRENLREFLMRKLDLPWAKAYRSSAQAAAKVLGAR